jgi:plasmid stabilization system protein ParE
MPGYRFTPEAAADLTEIWSFIPQDSVDAADRVESAIYEACALLAQTPQAGQVRKHFTVLPVRFWTLPPSIVRKPFRWRSFVFCTACAI